MSTRSRPALRRRFALVAASALLFPGCLTAASRAWAQTADSLQPQSSSSQATTTTPTPDADGTYPVRNGVSAPVLTFSVEPKFPEAARKRRLSGKAVVTLVIGPDGHPRDIHLLRSVGQGQSPKDQGLYATLDEEALKAVRQYRFKPARLAGKPVPVKLNVEVNFQSS